MNPVLAQELRRTAVEWDRAMVGNDPAEIGRFLADDWTIIGPDGRVGDKATFLALVKSGELSHDVMESHDMHVRIYGVFPPTCRRYPMTSPAVDEQHSGGGSGSPLGANQTS